MSTKLWAIYGHPGYTIEQTPGAWVLWGPCGCEPIPNAECPRCGGDGERIIDTCLSIGMLLCAVDKRLSTKNWRVEFIQ